MEYKSEIELPEHLIHLPGSDWTLWRCVALRGAGFPASQVLKLSSQECAEASDSLIKAEDEEERARQHALSLVDAALDGIDSGLETGDGRKALIKAKKALKLGRVPSPLDDRETINQAVEALESARLRKEAALKDYNETFKSGTALIARAFHELASDSRFQEAVIWQNRHAYHTGINALLKRSPETDSRGSKQRQHEELVANYLQRYSLKNDTIGFFGPVGWATLVSEGNPIRAMPGKELLAKREVYFETWAIDSLAGMLSKDEAILPWVAPRRLPFVRLDGSTVHVLGKGSIKPSAKQLAVIKACNEERTAKEIAAQLIRTYPADFRTEQDVYRFINIARNMGIIFWTIIIPLDPHPERLLRRILERIDDDALRKRFLDPLSKLETARDGVSRAANDPEKLDEALSNLEATFTDITGQSATRNAGEMYAARTLVYEDCRRDLGLEVGPQILEELGPPLSLLLTSVRWLTSKIAEGYRKVCNQIYRDLSQERGTPVIEAAEFMHRVIPILAETHTPAANDAAQELLNRWSDILPFAEGDRRVEFTSEQLRPRVMEAFNAPRPGWKTACYHSPDLMIAASSLDAINRGEYQLVLGELHVSTNTVRTLLFVEQHPAPQELVRAIESDWPKQGVTVVIPKDWFGGPRRTRPALSPSNYFHLELSVGSSTAPQSRTLQIGMFVVEDSEDGLVMRTRDGQLQFDLFEVVAEGLVRASINAFKIVRPAAHSPRVTIDRLIVSRESWHVPASEVEFAHEKDEASRFNAARRWAQSRNMPRFVFVKSPVEVKPFYVDFQSPTFINIFARVVRRTLQSEQPDHILRISEMLPTLEQLWLPDAEGRLYTSELRIVAVDQAR
jgi:hypothetical protein